MEDYNFSLKKRSWELLTEKKKGGDSCQTDSDLLKERSLGGNTWEGFLLEKAKAVV